MKPLFTLAAWLCFMTAAAQNTRLTDYNTIGWFNNFTTLKFHPRWSGHLEYQWRRANLINQEQQGLLRVGINYEATPRLQLRAGYAWAETYPYGDIPLQAAGRTFTEHRTYQMATLTDQVGRVGISHRLMLEQRWIGQFRNPQAEKEDLFRYLNRARYMLRMQVPLNQKTMADKTWYAAAYDEVFIGFGKNVTENVFDQNRLSLLLGYRFSKTFRVEGGYLQQIVQLGREVDGRNVFQNNRGLILNTYLTLDATRR